MHPRAFTTGLQKFSDSGASRQKGARVRSGIGNSNSLRNLRGVTSGLDFRVRKSQSPANFRKQIQ